jgi:predicted ATPase
MTGSGPTPLEALAHWLAARNALLVVDNCEHVLAAVGEVVDVLLERTTVTVMCTSREALGIDGEVVRAVGPLDAAAARRVFVERAVASGAELDASAPEIDEICARLDGLVLAIELAAARVRALGVAELAARLTDDLRMLSGRSRIERHQTIRATIEWSHRMLDPDEAVVFRRLALFANGCTLRAAESVVLGTHAASYDEPRSIDVVDAISHLVDRSLIVPFEGRHGTRYRLLEPMRRFAYERLIEAGEVDDENRAYVAWARDLWSDLAVVLQTVDEEHHWTRAVDEWDNLVSASTLAHRIGDHRSAHSMVASTFPFAMRRGRFDVASWALPILSDLSGDSDELFAEAAATIALAHVLRGEYEVATGLIDRADAAARAQGMSRHWRSALSRAQVAGLYHHDVAGALRCYEAALELEMSPTDAAIQHANLAAFVEIYLFVDGSSHRARAQELLEAHSHSQSGRAMILALLAFGATDPAEVRRLAHESIELADRVEATWPRGMARAELFRVTVVHDEPQDAFEHLLKMLPDLHRTGGLMDAYTVLWRAARLLTRLGLAHEALVLDELVRLAGSRTLFLSDDAMADLEPQREGLSTDEFRAIASGARALLASQHGSLRPVGEWIAALRPPEGSAAT